MMAPDWPGVSAVIPTIGRQELDRAIRSIRDQDYQGPIEIIVVGDLKQGSLDSETVASADVVAYTGGGKRGGAARNLGIELAQHPYIAFLDDDDEWLPQKLSAQIPVLMDGSADLVGTQILYRNERTGALSSPVPTRVLTTEDTVVHYLFRRRPASSDRPLICTPTLVVRSEVARRVRWNEALVRHQDWDWLERLEAAGAQIVQLPDASTVVAVGSEGSVSSSSDWESSLSWAESRADTWESGLLSDFLAGQPLRYALQARSLKGVARTIQALARTRRFPSFQTLLLGVAGIVPRGLINKVLSR